MTRKTSFYYSFLVLPKAERQAITAVFDVCRAIDDAVDLEPDAERAAAALNEWRTEIDRIFDGARPATAQGAALQPFVMPFRLPRAQFEALIDGVAMDATPRRFQTFDDLEPYCHRVASSVGLMCAEIFGYQDSQVLTYATDLGVALQLTNILRDVGVDLARDRLYVPLDEMARFGCEEADLRAGRMTPPVRALLAHQGARARQVFEEARAALPREDARRLVAAEIMGAIYRGILDKIEGRGFDVFSEVVRLPRPRRAVIAALTWARVSAGVR